MPKVDRKAPQGENSKKHRRNVARQRGLIAINYDALGEALTERRTYLGQSIRVAGIESGTSASTISRLETRCFMGLDAETFLKLCLYVGLPAEKFSINKTEKEGEDADVLAQIQSALLGDRKLSGQQIKGLMRVMNVLYKSATEVFKR
jgi:transcriptional regulator with XRE-family HTH domain